MGYIKTFSEFIKESFSSVKKLADSIYAVLDKEYSGNFYEPDINADSAEGLLKLLDGILKNVPDPALRRK